LENKYDVVFASDENYIQHLTVAIKSLLQNNKDLTFNIYIINGGISKEAWMKLRKASSVHKVKLIDILIDDSIFKSFVTNHHFTKAMYYRLLIPNFINSSKVLYLDADIIVNGNIKELYNTTLDDYYLAAVESPGFKRANELNMKKNSKYFNSGIMLINNKKWKTSGLSKTVVNYVSNNKKVIRFPDQDALNGVIDGNWKQLPLKYNQQSVIFDSAFAGNYNCFSEYEIQEAKQNPVIIHYTGSSKPWHFRNHHPYKYLYWKYLQKTPFKWYIPEDLTIINIIKWIIPDKLKVILKS